MDATVSVLVTSDLRYSDLRHSIFINANFRYADLRHANFSSANLRDAEIGVCKGGKGEGVEETQSASEGEIEAQCKIAKSTKIAESAQNI